MKILQLAPRIPFPEDDGGKISIANITKVLHKLGDEVTLVFYDSAPELLSIPEYAYEYAEMFPIKHNTTNTLVRIANSFIRQKSIYIEKHISSYVKATMAAFLKGRQYDIIHCDHTAMLPLGLFCKSILGCPLSLRLHNLEYKIWNRYADSMSPISPSGIFLRNQANLLKDYEAKALKLADISIAITDVDRDAALKLTPEANIIAVSAGVDPKEFLPDPNVQRDASELIHATVYSWRHNLSAIKWFIDEVFPLLDGKVEDYHLNLLGKSAPNWLSSYHPKVRVLGYVPKIQPYLNKAGIYIAPLFVGSGIRIKILEAMAMGLPTVASPISAEGINASEKDGLFIANSAEAFATYISNLIADNDFRINSGKSARNYILNNYDWNTNVALIRNYYQSLIDNTKRKNL